MSWPKIPGIPGLPGQPSEGPQKPLPAYRVEKKDKVFYVCEVCGSEYQCKVKNVRALAEAQEKAGKGVEDISKGAIKTAVSGGLLAGYGAYKIVKGAFKLSESAGKGILSIGMEDEIRRDALKYLLLCPNCQRWVCKDNCWDKSRGICLVCAKQREEAKQERREELQVIKAKNFCEHCGAKITDPAQTRCSNCGALLS
ncbi:MAG: hypothetical protein QXS27_02405 [Candidatus Jordarchaeaceae archaeon]